MPTARFDWLTKQELAPSPSTRQEWIAALADVHSTHLPDDADEETRRVVRWCDEVTAEWTLDVVDHGDDLERDHTISCNLDAMRVIVAYADWRRTHPDV